VAGRATGAGGFDEFYSASVRRVIHHVYALCGDLAEAQDVTQEAYTRAWLRWSKLSRYEDPEAWVRLVAYRILANRFRSLRRWFVARSLLGEPLSTPGPTPDRVAVLAALARLPLAQRRVVVLHHLHGLPVADIAVRTEMPVGTVKVYLSRARAALAVVLGDDEREDADVVTPR
jgi:RNA polymerase sigma-70 factor (ECF subfamily)